jgi:hypothetical protein
VDGRLAFPVGSTERFPVDIDDLLLMGWIDGLDLRQKAVLELPGI